MSKSVLSLVLQAVDEKRLEAIRVQHATELTAVSAESSWGTRQELKPEDYDAEQHQRVKTAYARDVTSCAEEVARWQAAYEYVLEKL